MNDLALLITMDIEGRLYIEATVPKEFVRTSTDEESREVRIPIPQKVAAKFGQALIEASAAAPDAHAKLEN